MWSMSSSTLCRAQHASSTRFDLYAMMMETPGHGEWSSGNSPPSLSVSTPGTRYTRRCKATAKKTIFATVTSESRPKSHQSHAIAGDARALHAWSNDAKPMQQERLRSPTTALPRSSPPTRHRPASLSLINTNGCTAISTSELKQRICDTRINGIAAIIQVPTDNREPTPPTPTTPPAVFAMGNAHSTHLTDHSADDKSMRSVVHVRRSSKPISRKSSFNVFKRIDSRSPLPRDVTASVMSILHRDGPSKDDGVPDSDGPVSVPTDPFFDQPEDCEGQYPRSPKVNSASTITMTESRAHLPLSASTTIRDFRSAETSEDDPLAGTPQINEPDAIRDDVDILSAISPTIPAPSPLPEDSPHKYGLRDEIDTPEVPDVQENIELPKARRKSSGPELFNEAKNLRSASSFLNGLSTARRRAESAAATHNAESTDGSWERVTGSSNGTSRPPSTRPPSRPSMAHQDSAGRRKGHNFKSSGFAYTRPLTLNQIKCYRGHNRLLLSRNKHAPLVRASDVQILAWWKKSRFGTQQRQQREFGGIGQAHVGIHLTGLPQIRAAWRRDCTRFWMKSIVYGVYPLQLAERRLNVYINIKMASLIPAVGTILVSNKMFLKVRYLNVLRVRRTEYESLGRGQAATSPSSIDLRIRVYATDTAGDVDLLICASAIEHQVHCQCVPYRLSALSRTGSIGAFIPEKERLRSRPQSGMDPSTSSSPTTPTRGRRRGTSVSSVAQSVVSTTERVLESDLPTGFIAATAQATSSIPTVGQIRRGSIRQRNAVHSEGRERSSIRRPARGSRGSGDAEVIHEGGLVPFPPLEEERTRISTHSYEQVHSEPLYKNEGKEIVERLSTHQSVPSPMGPIQNTSSVQRVYKSEYVPQPKLPWATTTLNAIRAFFKWFLTPFGFLVTIYGLNVVAWGGMLFLLLCNASPAMCHVRRNGVWLHDCNDIDSPRRIWIEIDSQILNALFCVTGFGLAPWRFRDLYYLMRYRFTSERKHGLDKKLFWIRKLAGHHRNWFRLPGSDTIDQVTPNVYLRSVSKKCKVDTEAISDVRIPIPTARAPDYPLSGVRAPPTKLWKVDWFVWCQVWNTFFQICLHDRPSWSTGLFVALACGIAGAGGFMSFKEGRLVRRVEGMVPSLAAQDAVGVDQDARVAASALQHARREQASVHHLEAKVKQDIVLNGKAKAHRAWLDLHKKDEGNEESLANDIQSFERLFHDLQQHRMATKRQAPDDHGVRPKRPRYNINPNKPANLSGKSFKKAHPVNELKSQVRSLRRLLERDLPANVRVEKERALQTVIKELEDAEKAKKKSEIIGRWHKVRFFDRQKAERRLKKARKALEDAAEADAELQKQMEDCEVDVNYAMYYPLEVDYVPLFPSKRKKDGGETENAEAADKAAARMGDQAMWEIVKKCMAEGTLQDLREGRLRAIREEADLEESASGSHAERIPEKKGRKDGRWKKSLKKDSGEDDNSEDETGRAFFGDD
ncbi:hypothetical protein AC579_8898 [Pseudocercospora musae]|uniref:Uncharacterized protein n=1 Tax=Pseudocercospora musae TaxID=113226 RepID=A0A139IDQ8_9PEZI|nr:hypothetical protein AC579_8898 [Pseudocercospora musae]